MSKLNDKIVSGELPEGSTPEDMLRLLSWSVKSWGVTALIVIGALALVSLHAALIAALISAVVVGGFTLVASHYSKPYREMIKARDNG